MSGSTGKRGNGWGHPLARRSSRNALRACGISANGTTFRSPFPRPRRRNRLYDRFEAQHEVLFGTRIGTPVEIVDVGVTVLHPRKRDLATYLAKTDWNGQAQTAAATRRMRLGGVPTPVSVFTREALAAGTPLTGPCLVEEPQSVTYIPDGSTGLITREGYLSISVGGEASS